MDILSKNHIEKTTKKMLIFINYVNNNWENIIHDSIDKTAKKINCSPSTINRFITILNFKNYNYFRIYVANVALKYKTNEFSNEQKNKNKISKVHQKIVNSLINEINITFSKQTLEKIEKIAIFLAKNKNLVIYNETTETDLFLNIANYLNALGIHAFIISNKNALENFNKIMQPKQLFNCILVFSNNLIENEYIKIIQKFKQKVLISNNLNLAKKFNHFILLNQNDRSDHSNLKTNNFTLLQIFFSNIINYLKEII